MIRYYTTFKRKLILGAILVILVVFMMGLTSDIFGAFGNPLTTYENFTYRTDGLFKMKFTAKVNFIVEWEKGIWNSCVQKPFSVPVGSFRVSCDDFSEILGWRTAWFIQLETLENMDTANSCDFTELYFAGEEYEVYFLNIGGYQPFDPYFDTYENVLEYDMRDKDDETNVDEESIFNLIEIYDETEYETYHTLNFMPEMSITYPVDETKIISNFEMEIDYSLAEGYNRIMVVFEDWHASSTCPAETDFSYWVEREAYFNRRSMAYFSQELATTTGTTTILVYGLEVGKYNCNKCFFVDKSGAMSENLCRGYDIEVLSYLPDDEIPQVYLPFNNWDDYYTENSERYATSTPLFDNLAWTFEPLTNNIGNIIIFFNNFFDPQIAGLKGEEFGKSIPILRGYLEQFNNFFGGIPISEFLLFYLITAIVVMIYRLVRGILTILIP